MKATTQRSIVDILVAYIFGCITFYIFLCFNGVVLASDIYSTVLIKFIKLFPKGDLRTPMFWAYSYTEQAIVSFVILFAFGFFILKILEKNKTLSSIFVVLGAITVDSYYFRKMPFDTSYFFYDVYKINFIAVPLWIFCFVLSLKLMFILDKKLRMYPL